MANGTASPHSSSTPPASLLPGSSQLIVALDFPSAAAALACADRLAGMVVWYKVGLELYLAGGEAVIRELKERGHSIFLDLKLHDIPNTVAGAVRALGRLEPDMLTVHAAGGAAMMQAAAEAAHSLPQPPRLLAVTVMTSIDAHTLAETGVAGTPSEQVSRLARLAESSGIDGLVCSPEEAATLRKTLPEALLVTPGIRPAGAAIGDQKRIATPHAALAAGASMLVVGRPITVAADPAAAAQAILKEMAAAASPQ